MRTLTVIFFILSLGASAQTKVFITSSQPFLLGDQTGIFTSTEVKSIHFNTQSRVEIWLLPKGGPMLKRAISPSGNTMVYELLQNQKGRWVLRYRGDETPGQSQSIALTPQNPWPSAVLAVVDTPKQTAIEASVEETLDPAELKDHEEPISPSRSVVQVPKPQVATTQEMLDRINAAAYEFEKLQLALEYVKNGTTVEEVIELGKLLQYETSRLEFFITAYPFCKNQQAYHMVSDYLEYEASKQRLRENMRPK